MTAAGCERYPSDAPDTTGLSSRKDGGSVLRPEDLYDVSPDLPGDLTASTAPVLVHGMGGFVDAGSAVRLAGEHLLSTLEHEVVATFDVDLLLDYRSRRPVMLFDQDHWESYAEPSLALHLVRDASGTPFLYLDGPEPDLYWERFVGALRQLIDRFGVRLTVGLNSIPMAVPHTRPVGLTAHGTRTELVSEHEPWVSRVQVPGSAGGLLEYRLGAAGLDAVGFAVHVPHYLVQADFPAAAEVLLQEVARIGGLDLPTAELAAAARTALAQVQEQVTASEEVAAVVRALEQQYDAFTGSRSRRSLLAHEEGDLPTGDELGAELERFLAEERRRGRPES